MTIAAVKEKLHDYIEHADDKKVKAIFTLLESDMEPDHEFSDEDMVELDRRWDDYLSGKTKSYTLEESMDKLRLHREARKRNGI